MQQRLANLVSITNNRRRIFSGSSKENLFWTAQTEGTKNSIKKIERTWKSKQFFLPFDGYLCPFNHVGSDGCFTHRIELLRRRIGKEKERKERLRVLDAARIEAEFDVTGPVFEWIAQGTDDERGVVGIAQELLLHSVSVLAFGRSPDEIERLGMGNVEASLVGRFASVGHRNVQRQLLQLAQFKDAHAALSLRQIQIGNNCQVALTNVVVPAVLFESGLERLGCLLLV